MDFFKGFLEFKDKIAPSFIDKSNPKFIKIENLYYSGILVVDYYREYKEIILKNLINTNSNIIVSMFYEKQDTYKTIKDLTYYIGNVGVDLKENNENRQDIDIASNSYLDAKYIRKEMQINNEELYYLYLYIEVYEDCLTKLEHTLNKIEAILGASGLNTRKANFRQEQCFFSCCPAFLNHKDLKNITRRNILTEGLIATYPFISSNIHDENGVFIGKNIYNDSLIFVDRFNREKYKNANMCIFGTSGAGKSFFTKLLILRCRLLGIDQFVIDPEREYLKISESLGGILIKIGPSSNTYINVLDIRKESIEEEKGYLANKLLKLKGFFNLIFGELDEENYAILEEKLIETYKQKGITFDDKSLFKNKKEFKENKDMPILLDLYKNIEKDSKFSFFKNKLKPFVFGSLKYFNNYTNISTNNKLIIADIYDLGEENIKYGMYIFIELFWDLIKKNRKEKKAIYLDEIWRLIGVTSNKYVAGFIYKIFKTIRKYGGSSIAITQDVSDLFSLEEGTYGKSILNNSSIKSFFSLEEENIKILEKYYNISEKERIEIKSLKRGEALMFIGENHVLTKIESSEKEREIID